MHSQTDKVLLALKVLEEALSIAQTLGDDYSSSVAWNSIGNTHLSMDNWEKALFAFDQSIVIAERIGDLRTMGMAIGNKGLIFASQRDYPAAIRATEDALAIAQKIGADPSIYLGNLANFYLLTGDPTAEIENYIQKVLRSGMEQQSRSRVLRVLDLYGLFYERKGIHLTTVLEFISANIADDGYTTNEMENEINPLLERIRQQVSPDEFEASLERGKTLDVMAVGHSLLKDPL